MIFLYSWFRSGLRRGSDVFLFFLPVSEVLWTLLCVSPTLDDLVPTPEVLAPGQSACLESAGFDFALVLRDFLHVFIVCRDPALLFPPFSSSDGNLAEGFILIPFCC